MVLHNTPENLSNPKRAILTQKLVKLERKLRLRWLLGVTAIPLFGIYAASAIAPQSLDQNIDVATVVETITLPNTTPVALSDDANVYWQAETVRRDDTLDSLLKRLNITNTEAISFFRSSRDASPFTSQLRPGQPLSAKTNADGVLLSLIYHPTNTTSFEVNLTDHGYVGHTADATLDTISVTKSAVINSSLFAATDAANIPDNIALQIVDIFAADIDFRSDLRRGDHFSVVYESNMVNGQEVNTGKVQAVEFVNNGKSYRAVMYRNPEGEASYYTPEGKSLHKSFLRSPLEFSRISSGFSLGRFHPILQTMRAHKGTDFAAPIGTRVKASGDAVVDFVGSKGGYGNLIVLKHANNISTVYGHLSRFADGLKRGTRVSQGDIIGFVGMTGLATGPHLHYEFLLNGEQHDPLKVALPTAVPLDDRYRADFMAKSAPLLSQLQLVGTSTVASAE